MIVIAIASDWRRLFEGKPCLGVTVELDELFHAMGSSLPVDVNEEQLALWGRPERRAVIHRRPRW